MRQERVPGKDGHRLAEDLVVRETPAAVVVVVHGRQVVVDQRVGVDQLEAARGGHDVVHLAAHRLGARDHQDRPETLAAREDAVPHRLVDDRRGRGRRRQIAIERLVHGAPALGEVRLEIERRHRAPRAALRSTAFIGRPSVRGPVAHPCPSSHRNGSARVPSLVLHEDLDPPLGLLEPPGAEAQEPRPLLEDAERVVERQVARLERVHDLLEARHRRLELRAVVARPDAGSGVVGIARSSPRRRRRASGACTSSTRHPRLPSWSRTVSARRRATRSARVSTSPAGDSAIA